MTLRLKKNISDDERYAAWADIVKRVCNEHHWQAWNQYMFRLINAVFASNNALSVEGGFILNWMGQNYIEATLMLIRRELDKSAGTENLRNLLLDIIRYPRVLTRERYCAGWGKEGTYDRELANWAFDSFNPKLVVGDSAADYIDPEKVQADLDQVVADAERIRIYAERTRAHRTPACKEKTYEITISDLHQEVADIKRIVKKYCALLTLKSIIQWEPTLLYDPIAPFTKPWVFNPEVIAAAINKGSEKE